ncbi:MAG: threonine--tRNA ligase [Dehalococcoidia bacterium]|nr:threonine--tRNA ligase [Dehalococcoidia bacterium]
MADQETQPPREDQVHDDETPFAALPAEERLFRMRHSAAHVLAEAVLEMFPEAKYAIGPPIEHGFYYDFDLPQPLVPDDLEKLEARMRQSVKADLPIHGEQISKGRAREVFANQPYKLELIDDIEDDTVGYFRHGEFQDLCRGGHTDSTGQIGAFKLTHSAGAYWRGDEHKPMLQRIYGALYPTQEDLDAYLQSVEEAQRRDHRRLGRELDLFHLDPISPGSPFFHPKGATLYNGLVEYVRELYPRYGYDEVITPLIFNTDIFRTSGHYDLFPDMYKMMTGDDVEVGVKPMNCPGHCVLFDSTLYSYRDLPIRFAEFTRLHRNERSGVLHGLTRVRSFSQDDSHIFCTPEQLDEEMARVFEMVREVYRDLALGEVEVRIATRPERFVGNPEDWDHAEELLKELVSKAGWSYEIAEGEGAFYAPKVEFHFRDAIGRSWQLGTVQIDMAMATRFGLRYIGSDGEEHTPVMIHRAILGSLERFLGVYIEHTEGRFPLWLAPVQAVVVPIADRHIEYAQSVQRELRQRGLRVEVDASGERMGAKIRKAQLQKVPYMLVVGDREAEAGAVALRDRSGDDLGAVPVFQVGDRMVDERDSRTSQAPIDA